MERIKEESRRRRQAILEKYKNKHQLEEQHKQIDEPQPDNSERGTFILVCDNWGISVIRLALSSFIYIVILNLHHVGKNKSFSHSLWLAYILMLDMACINFKNRI